MKVDRAKLTNALLAMKKDKITHLQHRMFAQSVTEISVHSLYWELRTDDYCKLKYFSDLTIIGIIVTQRKCY